MPSASATPRFSGANPTGASPAGASPAGASPAGPPVPTRRTVPQAHPTTRRPRPPRSQTRPRTQRLETVVSAVLLPLQRTLVPRRSSFFLQWFFFRGFIVVLFFFNQPLFISLIKLLPSSLPACFSLFSLLLLDTALRTLWDVLGSFESPSGRVSLLGFQHLV